MLHRSTRAFLNWGSFILLDHSPILANLLYLFVAFQSQLKSHSLILSGTFSQDIMARVTFHIKWFIGLEKSKKLWYIILCVWFVKRAWCALFSFSYMYISNWILMEGQLLVTMPVRWLCHLISGHFKFKIYTLLVYVYLAFVVIVSYGLACLSFSFSWNWLVHSQTMIFSELVYIFCLFMHARVDLHFLWFNVIMYLLSLSLNLFFAH